MKKLILVMLTTTLVLAACGSKKVSETVEATSEVASTEAETSESEDEKKDNEGQEYFDFTAEEFIEKLNKKNQEELKDPSTYKLSPKKGKANQVTYEDDQGILCVLEIDDRSNKVIDISVMSIQSEDFGLSDLAIAAAPVLMLLDDNLTMQDGARHLVDIALAAKITYGDSQYAYEGIYEGIQERVYGEDDFMIINFSVALEEELETKSVVSNHVKVDFGELKDDIYSFQIQVNDDVYQFPMSYEDFLSFGWVYAGDPSQKLSAGSYRSTEVFNIGDLRCYAGIMNFDVNERQISDCYVISIQFDTSMVEKSGAVVTLPGGISLSDSLEEAIAVYGTPTNDSGSNMRYLTYQLDYSREVKISSVYEKLDTIGTIEVKNITTPDDFIASEVSDKIPAIVEKYQAPTALSDEFTDFIVEYGGDLYQLPAPVSEFVSHGWTVMEDDTTDTIAGKDSGWVTLMKDNQKLRALAKNYDQDATNSLNGFITVIESDIYSKKTPIVIANNITVGMSKQELENALSGINYETEDSGNFVYYKIYPTDAKSNHYSISIAKDSDSVSTVIIKYEPKISDYTNR